MQNKKINIKQHKSTQKTPRNDIKYIAETFTNNIKFKYVYNLEIF